MALPASVLATAAPDARPKAKAKACIRRSFKAGEPRHLNASPSEEAANETKNIEGEKTGPG